MTPPKEGLETRIDVVRAKAATPGYARHVDPEDVDVAAWNHVGDPIAEALVGHMREHKLMGGDLLATARRLRAERLEVAEAFFADVEFVPAWADFDAMRAGAAMGLRHPIGMMMGLHGGLPFTYVDTATARVMASTGRVTRGGRDFQRRFWETASGFVGALDVDGMKPHGPRWEEWVRIRLLHTMIRLGILRSGRWDACASAPINQTATAVGAHIFGTYRVKIIEYFGGRVAPDEAAGFALMWRWIARIEGANTELLGTTEADQLCLAMRISELLYHPTEESRGATDALVDGVTAMKSVFPVSRRVHVAVIRALLADDMVQVFPGRDLPADLGLDRDHRAELIAGAVVGVDRGLTRLIASLPIGTAQRQQSFDRLITSKLGHRRPTYRATPVRGDRG